MDWHADPPPLTGLSEDVLHVTFYFLYTECLPRGLSEATAQKCVKLLGKMPGFSKLGKLCETFLENTALTQRKRSVFLFKIIFKALTVFQTCHPLRFRHNSFVFSSVLADVMIIRFFVPLVRFFPTLEC